MYDPQQLKLPLIFHEESPDFTLSELVVAEKAIKELRQAIEPVRARIAHAVEPYTRLARLLQPPHLARWT